MRKNREWTVRETGRKGRKHEDGNVLPPTHNFAARVAENEVTRTHLN